MNERLQKQLAALKGWAQIEIMLAAVISDATEAEYHLCVYMLLCWIIEDKSPGTEPASNVVYVNFEHKNAA